jgi:hypothetical protein
MDILEQAIRIARQHRNISERELGNLEQAPAILERAERRLVVRGPLFIENVIVGQDAGAACVCRMEVEQEQLFLRAFGDMAVRLVYAPSGRFCLVEARWFEPSWVMIDVRSLRQ